MKQLTLFAWSGNGDKCAFHWTWASELKDLSTHPLLKKRNVLSKYLGCLPSFISWIPEEVYVTVDSFWILGEPTSRKYLEHQWICDWHKIPLHWWNRYFQSKWSIRKLIAVQTISTGLTLAKNKREKLDLTAKMCFVTSAQRKTYWINGIWQICLANTVLQVLHPCASSNSLVSFCTVLQGACRPGQRSQK